MFKWIGKLFAGIGSFFVDVAKTFVGRLVEDMKDDALAVVKDIEENYKDLQWREKKALAIDSLEALYPKAKKRAINLAIEMAVVFLKEHTEK